MSNRTSLRARNSVLYILYCAVSLSFVTIVVLLATIFNNVFGFVALQESVPAHSLTADATPFEQLTSVQLRDILDEHLSAGLIRRLDSEVPLEERSVDDLRALVVQRVIEERIVESYTLFESLFKRSMIDSFVAQEGDNVRIVFRSWIRPQFLLNSQTSRVEDTGIRTALLGSMWMIAICIVIAFPIGIATAIYLEEYARDTLFTRLIRINIYNLAGIPSIIYGILGLTIFVRALEPFTSGRIFGLVGDVSANGRTVISAGATLALLIVPIIIINAQEALRATPHSIRDSSYGLGATKWQTVWHNVLPYSIDRIITGAILALSRAIGETAPLVVIGAATFIAVDPKHLFSKFTTLPIQIFQWAARPQDEYRHLAAAAILILLVVLLSMNSIAVILRNHYSRKRRLLT